MVSNNAEEAEKEEDTRAIDVKEKERVQAYMAEGCGYSKECSSRFDEAYLTKMRSDCAELTHEQLDLAVMGQLLGFVVDSKNTGGERHSPHPTLKKSCQFLQRGNKVQTS